MSEPGQIAKEAASNFELDHFGNWPGDDIAAVKFQNAIDEATKFQIESFFVGLAEATGKPVGSFKTGGEWIDYIKGQLAAKDKEITELQHELEIRIKTVENYHQVFADKNKRLDEARHLIGSIGWTSSEFPDVIKAAEKWLEGKP